jgi:hypothetical protein
MATLVACNTSDGRTFYVNVDNAIHLHATDDGGTAIRFIGDVFFAVTTPIAVFLDRKALRKS